LTREEKQQVIAKWQERFKEGRLFVFADFQGLNVAQMTELRRMIRECSAECEVVKNTLLKKAAAGAGREDLEEFFVGPTMIISGADDPTVVAKTVKKFVDEHQLPKVKAGMLLGSVLGSAQVFELAAIPSREVLLAQLIGVLQAPITGFVGVLQANLRKLVCVLNAIKEKKA